MDYVGGVNLGMCHPRLAGAKSRVPRPPKQARADPDPAHLRARAHAAPALSLRNITILLGQSQTQNKVAEGSKTVIKEKRKTKHDGIFR